MTSHSGSTEAKAIDDVRSLEDAYNVQVAESGSVKS